MNAVVLARENLISYRLDALPAELQAARRWLVWRLEERTDAGEVKVTKVPYDAKTGRHAATTRPATWTSFKRAVKAYKRGGYDGVGFVFGDGITGLDLDKCRDAKTGVLEAWADEHVRHLGSYTEVSPSGTGVHVLLRAKLPPGRRRKGRIEMYDESSPRFFAMTGVHIEQTPAAIEQRQAELDALHREVFGDGEPTSKRSPTAELNGIGNGRRSRMSPDEIRENARRGGRRELTDQEVLERAFAAKNGGEVRDLLAGKWRGRYPSQSEADQALCSHLAFWCDGDATRVDRLFRRSGLYRDKWDRASYREPTIANAIESVASRSRGNGTCSPASKADDRAEIVVSCDLTAMVTAAERALLKQDVGIYQRAGSLVRVLRMKATEKKQGLERPGGAPVIAAVPAAHLLELMSDAASWVKPTKRGEDVPTLPPRAAVEALLARGEWRLPALAGVVEAPVLRADGSVLDARGYDEATGLLYEPAVVFPPILVEPDLGDAKAALAELSDVLVNFPFAEPCDRAAAIALILTPFAMHAIDGPAPLFAIRAPERGTGKTLLARVAAVIAAGRAPLLMTQSREEAEERKRILSLGLEGASVVLIDNVEKPLGSAALAAALTSREFSDRVLGVNRTARAPLDMTWITTGNNLVVKGDLGRRIVPIDLDARVERPEARKDFKHPDLLGHVRENRGRLAVAAVTVLRAYRNAGKRPDLEPFGSFESWSDLVRSALVWLGESDPCAGRERIRRDSDPALEALRALLAEWHRVFGDKPTTLARAISTTENQPALQAVLAAICERGDLDRLDATQLGYELRKHRGRIVDGLRLDSGDPGRGGRSWTVIAVTEEARQRSSKALRTRKRRHEADA